jgi:methionyl-tRNA formyltransferase
MVESALDLVVITENPGAIKWLLDIIPQSSCIGPSIDWKKIPKAKLYLSFYYGKIIPKEVLNMMEGKIFLNLHNSLLPSFKGLHAFSWAIEAGELSLGYTLHEIDETLDGGKIYDQIQFHLSPHCDINCAFRLGGILLEDWLPQKLHTLLSGEDLEFRPQDKNLGKEIYRRRSGPYLYKGPIEFKKIRNVLRASNPPYGKGAIIDQLNQSRIYYLDSSPESRLWIQTSDNVLFSNLQIGDESLQVYYQDI